MKYTPEDFLRNATAVPVNTNELWWYTLKNLNQKLAMGLDFNNWTYIGRPCKFHWESLIVDKAFFF